MTDQPLKLGTRASPLALAQAHMVRDALLSAHGWDESRVEIAAMTASGDRILDRPLAEVGGKALWTKELDRALFEGEIDFAVHSMKDVETLRPAELAIVAMLPRADVRDRLIGAPSIAALPQGARVGTSSPRRAAQLLRHRPDLNIVLFRGNVATRLAKLAAGEADATLLAAAGLDRLGQSDVGVAVSEDDMLPAPAQGAIGIETHGANDRVQALLAPINDAATFACVMAERAFLATLSADCHSPVAAQARLVDGQLHIRGEILSPDGALCEAGDADDPVALAQALLDRAPPSLRALFG
ncbi:MAG: hydroxymethylbilane synthase [Chakrabartia godavariana]